MNNAYENYSSKDLCLSFQKNNKNNKVLGKSLSNINSNNNDIKEFSFIDFKLRDEILNRLNVKSDRFGTKNYYNKQEFYESVEKRILLKKYIYELNKKYINDINRQKIDENKIIEKSKQTENIFKLITQNKLNILIDYNLFLQEKIHKMKQQDFEYYKYIENLKSEIKNLFIKIKIQSDKLWLLFDIRNFLICVKESISIKQLPLFFRFYNSDYLDDLTKKNENDIYLLEKMEKPKKSMNLFRIPTNLLVYIDALNGLDKEGMDKRFSKYLNVNYVIFNSVEEFIKKYVLTENMMLNHLRNSLLQNNYNEFQKYKLSKQINIIEKENKIFENDYKNTKKIYDEMKNDNNDYNKKIDKISLLKANNEEKNETEIINKEKENNEKFLKTVEIKYNIEKNYFLLKYNELKNNKKFKTEKEYVYYFIYKNIFQLYKIYPEYFHKQNIFSIKKMYLFINNIKNCDKFSYGLIQSNVIYLLTIYENAISSFLLDYKKSLESKISTNLYNKIKNNFKVNRKCMLLKKQKILENKVKKMRFEKYNEKQTRYRYLQRNPNIINPKKFQKNNSVNYRDNKQKDSYCEENNLLNYYLYLIK